MSEHFDALLNDKLRVGFKRLNDNAVIPTKAHASDSGFDLVASEDVIIEPGETKVIPTGIAVQLPEGYEAQVRPRSGVTSRTKLRVQLGTIDQSYIGEIGVIVDNTATGEQSFVSLIADITGKTSVDNDGNLYDDPTYIIRKGDRIAQLVVQALPSIEAYEVDTLEDTERGESGFGSSGVRSE